MGVPEVQLGVVHRGAVRGERGLQRIVAGALGPGLVARDQAPLVQILVTRFCRSALLAVAVSRASTASACDSAAWNGRGSSVKSGWPLLDACPSMKCIALNCPVVWARIWDRPDWLRPCRPRESSPGTERVCGLRGDDRNRTAPAPRRPPPASPRPERPRPTTRPLGGLGRDAAGSAPFSQAQEAVADH